MKGMATSNGQGRAGLLVSCGFMWAFRVSLPQSALALGVLRGCLGFLQTSTYQAVLTTDGNLSFALLLYQDGGMRWDYTKLAAGNVLIGFSRCCAHVWLRFGPAGISLSTMLGTSEMLSPGEPSSYPQNNPVLFKPSLLHHSSSHPNSSMGSRGRLHWEGDPKSFLSTQRRWLCPK